jgi:hypothetical protein
MRNSSRHATHWLWLWPAAAASFAAIACVTAWQKSRMLSAIASAHLRGEAHPPEALYYPTHNALFAWGFVEATVLGLALCVVWRWPSRPSAFAVLFLFVAYFIVSFFGIFHG